MQEDRINPLKFVPPGPPTGFVPRPRLAQAVALGLGKRLILLQAPAGYGKTSLLSSVASEWDRFTQVSVPGHLAWCRLDPGDDDAAVFLDGLVRSVRRVVPGFGRVVGEALHGTPDPRGRIQQLVAIFLDELRDVGQDQVTIVLDNFHLITDRAIVDAIERSIQAPDSPLRLIVSTQVDPRFYLSVLRAREELVELRSEELVFTADEVRELVLRRVGRSVSDGAIGSLARETGGWPSIVGLATLIMARDRVPLPSGRLAPTDHGYLLLVRELLRGLPADRIELLLRISLLREVDLDSCRDGVGLSDPLDAVRLLEEMALPVTKPLGHDSPLCLEPLLRSTLQRELASRLLPHELQALQRRVASQHCARFEWDEAIRTYLEAGAHDEAAAVVERAATSEEAAGHLDTVSRWIRALPTAVRKRHPRLMVQEARLSLARDRLDEARVLLVAAHSEMQALGDRDGEGRRLGVWAAMQLLGGRYPQARQSAAEALQLLSGGDSVERAEMLWLLSRTLELVGDLASAFSTAGKGLMLAERSGQRRQVIRSLLQLGRLARLRGEFAESLALSARAVQLSASLESELPTFSAAAGTAAAIHMERDQAREAAVLGTKLLETSQRLCDPAGEVRGGLLLAAASERLGRSDEAGAALDRACALAARLPARQPERMLALQAAAAAFLRKGRRKEGTERARQALREAVAASHTVLIGQCQLIVAVGEMAGFRLPGALIQTRRLCEAFQRSDSKWLLSGGLRLLAQGYYGLGLPWPARANLRKSLALATAGGYVGMPLGLPSERERLLKLAARDGVALDVAGTLLGLDENEGKRALAPLLAHKKPMLRSWAEQVVKGLAAGAGRPPAARLPWPGTSSAAASTSSSVSLRSLGSFRPFVDGQLVEWPSTDARDLAAYLLVNRGRFLPRDRALQELWPEVEDHVANLRLHVALYRVREALGPGLPPVDPTLDARGVYRWGGAGCFLDVETFRRRLRRARQLLEGEQPPPLSGQTCSLLEQAVELYEGEFLAGLSFEWCLSLREELRAQLLWATRLLVDHHMALRNWKEAIRYGLQSLRSDPMQEDVVRDLMLCYHRVGDRGAVLQQYREVKRLLARERGAWPSDETRELRIRLLGK